MKRVLFSLLLISSALCVLTGCRGGVRFPRCCATKVVVTLDGSPMEGMKVTFYPKESIGNFSIQAETDSSGTGDIQTIATGKKKDGAPKGEFRVTVEKIVRKVADDDAVKDLESRMGEMSQQEYIAEMQRLNQEKAEQNREMVELVPESLRDMKTTPLTYTVSSKGELAIELSDYAE